MCCKNVYFLFFLASQINACGTRASTSALDGAWGPENDPGAARSTFDGTKYERAFTKLPLKGEVENKAWSDAYWASATGGIAYRWQCSDSTQCKAYAIPKPSDLASLDLNLLSPAEKYDLFVGRFDFPLVRNERSRTQVMRTVQGTAEYDPNFKIFDWEGLSHGWAPAAFNFKEPKNPVEVSVNDGNTVTFYPSDIKALLVYYQQYTGNRSTTSSQIGMRCTADFAKLDDDYKTGKITDAQLRAAKNDPACAGINAGSLHLVLANELGINKHGFAAEISRDERMWHQPVNGFQTDILRESPSASPGAAPGTSKEVSVHTTMFYSKEVPSSIMPSGAYEQGKDYYYTLELNSAGEVVGGRWDQEDRPAFVWRETTPAFRGYFVRLEELYKNSI